MGRDLRCGAVGTRDDVLALGVGTDNGAGRDPMVQDKVGRRSRIRLSSA